jgi:hypothetical protein
MIAIRAILGIVTMAPLFCAGPLAASSSQAAGKNESPKAGHLLEITQVDVFAKHNWTAEDISVLGFYLGMSRVDAIEGARKQSLGLNCADYCDVCDQQNVLCSGIGLHFGSDDRVEEIVIMRPLQEASPDLRRASVTQQAKGQTYIFFHEYSSDLRLKLFGRESGHEGGDPVVRSATYLYPRMGIKIHLSLSGNKRITESEADLEVSFGHPKNP